MATHDYVIDNSTGANVRADINSVLQAILSNNSNSSAPSTTAAYMLWADTTANIVKIRNSSNNAWINLFTTAGGVDVDAASNFNEDVTFTGASYNVVWDKSDNALEFGDNAKAYFGAGNDLQIHHDGANSNIYNQTNSLYIRSADVRITNAGVSEHMAKFFENGTVELYYDNSKKFETRSDGVLIGDSQGYYCGDGADLRMFFNGTDGYIRAEAGKLHLDKAGGEKFIVCNPDAAVEIYYDNGKKFQTISDGFETGSSFATDGSVSGVRITAGSIIQTCENSTGFRYAARFYNPNGQVGYISTQNSTTTFNTSSSDISMKKNFEDWTENTLDLFKNINPQKFNFIGDDEGAEKTKGFIAQEMVASFPEAYTKGNEEDAKYAFNPSGMVVYLMKSLQETVTKIETLETKVAALEAA